MLRLMFALFAFLWSALLDTGGGGGGDDDPPEDPDPSGGSAGGAGESPDPRNQPKWSDNDVNKFKGDAREEGRQSERNAWTAALGVKDQAEAKQIVEAHREHLRSQQSEDERRAEELKREREAKEAAEKRAIEAEKARERVNVERAVEAEMLSEEIGVKPERLKAAMRHADLSKVQTDDAGNVTGGAKEAAQAAKDEAPELFEGDGDDEDAGLGNPRGTQGNTRVRATPQNRGGKEKKRAAWKPRRVRPGQ